MVDHQVTITQFKNGKTVCHTMAAFSQVVYRDIKIYATKAELIGMPEDNLIKVKYFDGTTEEIVIYMAKDVRGHGGGDYFLMASLFKVLNGEECEGITYLDVSIESHLMSFSAEESINQGQTVFIKK